MRIEGRASTLRLASGGHWIRVKDQGEGAGTVLPSPIELSRDGDRWRLAGSTGPVLRLPIGTLTFSTTPGEPRSLTAVVRDDGREKHLTLGAVLSVVSEGAGSRVDLVATLPIETYLPGVLAKELYQHWSPDAFRAQAIAARSFAVCEAAPLGEASALRPDHGAGHAGVGGARRERSSCVGGSGHPRRPARVG